MFARTAKLTACAALQWTEEWRLEHTEAHMLAEERELEYMVE